MVRVPSGIFNGYFLNKLKLLHEFKDFDLVMGFFCFLSHLDMIFLKLLEHVTEFNRRNLL